MMSISVSAVGQPICLILLDSVAVSAREHGGGR
jgi:hypothetical protein